MTIRTTQPSVVRVGRGLDSILAAAVYVFSIFVPLTDSPNTRFGSSRH
jgi:hypothetical protein